ncbi:low molecular weight protein-tyrosine-phosphatase [Corynebacterium guangdongense]|uniref:protein-tyrosine-phosphatase n=1 Tax=Corynebacterium guangdongense TaxID=1783348 RepID=A0ABU1ZY17_9CORY|nr:low molecular weight protein-tyrosine-phosphatase [Corynebacterium guangdongense]MDR7329822.1 protein-tyrosine phosphatase [Corynebacterium guangdongense]WJZ18385.1 putative low molecular weight protein-tyrosine-phosphatase [Corynebacterium guangdongense]
MTGPSTDNRDFSAEPLHVTFVCLGNICRSPMAEVIFTEAVARAGLEGLIRVSSSGTGDWHVGEGADERALRELADNGYDGSDHRASQVGPETLAADLIIALDTNHRSSLIVASGAAEEKVRMLRDFDPAAGPDASVADPYFGGPAGFITTREQIEAAVPGILDWARAQLNR